MNKIRTFITNLQQDRDETALKARTWLLSELSRALPEYYKSQNQKIQLYRSTSRGSTSKIWHIRSFTTEISIRPYQIIRLNLFKRPET